eukprot:6199510-Karenia_brevis.AAC.1
MRMALEPSAPPSYSGYSNLSQSETAASSKMSNKATFSPTPSESSAITESWSKVDFVNSPVKDE